MGPKISVIVPIYKVEPYLRKCLDSIQGQTYRNLEIILVDDGSPDGCGAICDEYAARDTRFTVIHKANGGLSSARNAGLDVATGDWIGGVDGDDWIESDMFEYLLAGVLEHGGDIAVCGWYEDVGDEFKRCGPNEVLRFDWEQGLREILSDGTLRSFFWNKLYRRELWQDIRFPLGRTYEDVAVMYRLYEKAQSSVYLPEPKYHYVSRMDSITKVGTLKSGFDCFAANKERYEDLYKRRPQLKERLTCGCVEGAIVIWSAYLNTPKETRKARLPEICQISDFCRPYIKDAVRMTGKGLSGRLQMRLVAYPTWWSFWLSREIGRAYLRKYLREIKG